MSRLVPAILALTVLLSLQTGCTAPSPTRGGFASAAPAARTFAVEETVRNANARGVVARPDLYAMVELLLADDDLVRFMAIAGLQDLAGDARGYRFYDPPEVRYQAILDWREYVRTAKAFKSMRIEPPPANTTADGMTATKEDAQG